MIIELDNISENPFSKRLNFVENNITIGFIDYSLIYDRIEIDNVFVMEEYRNKKVATKLLEYLYELAKKKKLINITLEVRISNTIAINLYEKVGFQKVALRKYYYGDEDAILMEKQVK